MSILAWVIFGLLAGMVAQVLLPGDDPGGRGWKGWLITMAIGIAGAVIGGFIAAAVGLGGVSGFNLWSFLIAVAGAILVLFLWRIIARQGGGHGRRRLA